MAGFVGSTAGSILVIVLAVLVALLFVLVVSLSTRINRLSRRYRQFMRGSDGVSIEKMVTKKLDDIDKLSEASERHEELIGELKSRSGSTLSKYGIIKYDAFDDVGGKMSFALALLDSGNNGFVIDAIHSRDNCYVYIKEIVNGESYIMLSNEEIQALREASGK